MPRSHDSRRISRTSVIAGAAWMLVLAVAASGQVAPSPSLSAVAAAAATQGIVGTSGFLPTVQLAS